MSNLDQLINSIPQMPRRQVAPPTQQDVTSRSIEQVLSFIARELPIKKDLANSQALHLKLVHMMDSLEALIEKTDVNSFAEDLRDSLAEIKEKMASPIVNVDFPKKELLDIKKILESMNLGGVTRAIDDLKPLLSILDKDEDASPKDVILDKQSKVYLKNLELLDTDAKNPIAVRLSDGKEFYKSVGNLNDGIRAMTGSSGNNFLTPEGNPTKANLDANGNLRVVTDTEKASTATNTFATIGVSSGTVMAANANRVSLTLVNDSANIIYVAKGSTAVVGSGVRLNASGGSLIIDDYTGIVTAIATGASSNLTVCEV